MRAFLNLLILLLMGALFKNRIEKKLKRKQSDFAFKMDVFNKSNLVSHLLILHSKALIIHLYADRYKTRNKLSTSNQHRKS